MKNRLKELRKKHGIKTQLELANKVGCSEPMVGLWEQGKQRPSIEHGIELCKIYGVTLDYLYCGLKADNGYLAGKNFTLDNIAGDEADELLQCLDSIRQVDGDLFDSMTREINSIGNKIMRAKVYKQK